MASPSWKLYGVPLSQPFRSVAWALLQNKIRFEVQLTVPGASNEIGTRSADYVSKSKTGRVPLLEDTNTGFILAESPAILSHLCERYGWESMYGPPGSSKKATIDSYMHWHHNGTRTLAKVALPYLRPESNQKTTDEDQKKASDVLRTLDEGWFSSEEGEFLGCFKEVSIADLLAYEEVIQLASMGLLDKNLREYPKLFAWTQQMNQLPFHEEVHMALRSLGDVTDNTDDTPMPKRLSRATKAGLQALSDAQANFLPETSRL